jgi:hypothetical protein
VVPPGVRFQVCLPTAMSSACLYVSPGAHEDYLRVYERSLLRGLEQIIADVPHRELSLQWDICQEVLVFETYFESRPADYKARIFALLERLGAAVPAEVELGYHLCYGSPADQHLVMPKDAAILAELTRAILERARRPVDFIHLPVPRERTDAAYFAPLRGLRLPTRTRRAAWTGRARQWPVASGWPPSAAGGAASPPASTACWRAIAARWTTWSREGRGDRRHARPGVAHLLLPAPAPTLRGLGQPGPAAAPAAPRRTRPLP